jgi:ubiquinone/menaquinone biosynthesis C-methylase UbiE
MSRSEAAFCCAAPWRLFAGRALVPWLLGDEELKGSVLELGSGSGAMAAEYLERFPGLELTATDLDPGMIEAAGSRLSGFGGRARVEAADATELTYPDGSFDGVIAFGMLHHVGPWEKALAEAARVLRPGGLLLAADFVEFPGLIAAERATGNPGVRPIRWGLLEPELRKLPLTDVRARRAARAVFRLRATKAP